MEGLWQKWKRIWAEFSTVNAGTCASSIAYFAFLSLVPLLALIISLVSIMGIGEQEIVAFVTPLLPPSLDELGSELIRDAFNRSSIAFSISTIVLLWSASKGIKAFRNGLNASFGVQETRSAPVVIAISIGTVILVGVLVAAVMYLIFSAGVKQIINAVAPGLLQSAFMAILNPVLVVVLAVLILSACYAYLPAGKRRFVSQMPGATLATLACGVFTFGFYVYVEHFSNFTVLYGSIATVALLLVWIYLASYILLAGSFVNRLLSERAASKKR